MNEHSIKQPDNLNAAQFAKLKSDYDSALREVIAAMQLRKWLVGEILTHVSVSGPDELLAIAEKLHTFITAPASKPIGSP